MPRRSTCPAEAEPEIFATTSRFGTVVENVAHDPDSLELDFTDTRLTENTRCAYPLDYVSNASPTGLGGHPRHVVMLTCDALACCRRLRGFLQRRRCTTSCPASLQGCGNRSVG